MAKSDIITRAKIESEQWTKGMRGMSSELDKFRAKSKGMSSEGMALDKVLGGLKSGFGAIAGAVGVSLSAMEAFNKTIASSEQLTDLMGATMQQVHTIVDSFFVAIANADFSNFVNGLSDITRRAREAYDAVDALGTLKMFQTPQAARINADIAEQRAIIRNPDASAEQKKAAKARLEQLTGEMYDLSADLQKQAMDAFKASIRNSIGKNAAGVTDADIDRFVAKNLSSKQAFDQMKRRLAFYEGEIRKRQEQGTQYVSTGPGTGYNMTVWKDTAESRKWSNLIDYRLAKAAATMRETEIEAAFKYLTEAENARGSAANTAASNYRLINARVGGGGGGKGGGKPGPSVPGFVGIDFSQRLRKQTADAFEQGLKEASGTIKPMAIWQPEEFQAVDDVMARAAQKKALYEQTTAKIAEMKAALQYASGDEAVYLQQSINQLQNVANAADPAAANLAKMSEQAQGLQNIATAASAIGQAFAATGNKTMAAVGNMIGSFATLISTYASLKASALQAGVAQSGALPPPYNIVMIATTVAALASAMATVSSFAQGGIVGGANFRDGISARVSSGEMIINEADQHRLFDAIHNGGAKGGGNSYISGEQIVTVVNAYGRRTGHGEYLK